MSQILKKFIDDDAVDGSKIKLSNNEALQARNQADSADIDLIKLNASDKVELPTEVALSADFLPTSSGAYDLGSTGAEFADVWFGNWKSAASVYVSPSGTDLSIFLQPTGTGAVDVNGKQVVNAAAPTASDHLATKDYVDTEVAGVAAPTFNKLTVTLAAGDITNQYVDLAHVAKTGSIHFIVKGGAPTLEGASHDYSVNYTGGAGGNSRITFLNDLATGGAAALVAGDVVQVTYAY